MPPEQLLPSRAGFWRRLSGFLLDVLLGGLVVATLGSFAFSLSSRRVQTGPFGLVIQSCNSVSAIPTGLTPSPPDGSNFARICTFGSIPGVTMMQRLTVGKRVVSPGRVIETGRSYLVSADGSPIAAFDASWIGILGFLAYVAGFICRKNQTVGMRLLETRMIVAIDPERQGIPPLRLAVRVAVAIGGFVPAIAAGAVTLLWTLRDPEHAPIATGDLIAATAMLIWFWWNAILVGRKLDPLYDRYSGLAVVRVWPAVQADYRS